MINQSPDGAGGGGATSGTTETGEDLFKGDESAGATIETTETPTGVPTGAPADAGGGTGTDDAAPAASTGLSKDDIKDILAGALESVGGKTTDKTSSVPVAREWTQEDFDRTFNVLKFSPELLQQLRHETPEVALKALAQIRDGMVRQAMTMAEYRIQQLVKEIRDNDLAPIQSYVTEQQATGFRNDFFKDHPDLEKYEEIVDAVALRLESVIKPGTPRADVMKRYAEETQKILEKLKVAGGDATVVNGGKKANGTPVGGKNRMSTLTGGGQNTGGGGRGAAEPKGPPGIEVFD